MLVVGLLLWSAATAMTAIPCLTAATQSAAGAVGGLQLPLLILLAARGLMGLASAAAMPCVTAISAQQVPDSDRGSAVSYVYASFNLGETCSRTPALPHLNTLLQLQHVAVCGYLLPAATAAAPAACRHID